MNRLNRRAFFATLWVVICLIVGLREDRATGQVNLPASRPPAAFLALLVSKTTPNLVISQGWDYSKDERDIHPDIPRHFGADVPLPWGTPIYAPADGLALASYHLYDLESPSLGKIGYGLGLFIQIWHEGPGVYSMCAHLSGISNKIPYLPPVLEGGTWQPREAIYVPVETFKKNAVPIKRGELIAKVGYTGLRWKYPEEPANPLKVDPETQKTWDPHGAHLHWEVYTRTPDGKRKQDRYDPFGIYGEREAYKDVFTKASGLILANPDGSPQFAK